MKGFSLSRKVYALMASVMMLFAAQSAMAQYVPMTFLSGSKTGNEGCAYLIDGKTGTKWGQSFDPSNPDRSDAHIIFKTETAVVPSYYFLCIGNDTAGDPKRNWQTWKIYGGNFASDAEATVDAEWTLLEDRLNGDLPPENFAFVDFKFNKADGNAYQYYYIRVEAAAEPVDVYLQMSEFGLCSVDDYYAYLNRETSVNEPLAYKVISGTKNDGSGEALDKLFDGNSKTKWGNGFTNRSDESNNNGAYFIVKTSRSICPTFYRLTTANDTKTNPGRNWRKWRIYAMKANDDAQASRTSEQWVLIDRKSDISTNQLPADNYTDAFFSLSEENTNKYNYFRVELDEIVSSGQYMQMAEFALGDENTLKLEKDAMYQAAVDAISMDIFAQKTLLDEYAQLLEDVNACTDPSKLGTIGTSITKKQSEINLSASNYESLFTAAAKAKAAIYENTVDAAGLEYLTKFISDEVIAPNVEFPVGNYAYVVANRQLTGDEAVAESKRISAFIEAHNTAVVEPITAKYEAIDGSGGYNDKESHEMLIDGDRDKTKWCVGTTGNNWLIFKSTEPIKPTYYGLVTGGDTYSYPGRNWKTWDVYAGDFASDEEATRDAEGWILIDERKNVGTEVLKTFNKYESYIDLNHPASKEYQYYMIVVKADCGAGMIQMNEFTFYNMGNFREYRESFVQDVQDSLSKANLYLEDEIVAKKSLLDEFNSKFEEMKGATDAPSLMELKNRLMELITEIRISSEKYAEYADAVEAYSESDFSDYPQAYAWAQGYFNENVAANDLYVRGTKQYILENMPLDNDEITAEIEYLESMYLAAVSPEDAGYIVLGGNTVGQWGDGHYKHIVDNIVDKPVLDAEGNQKVNAVGEKMFDTKWGGEASASGDTYVIFRTIDATNPYFYTLTTGGDTHSYQGRNWKTWEIYGANFAGDGAATKDAEGWVLLDKKENIGKNRLHPESMTASYFGFNQKENLGDYIYYKVVVYAAYSGNAIQMQELRFGTEEEFEVIKDEYETEAEFDTDVVAEQALLDEYEAKKESIEECTNMEDLFAIHDELENLKKAIKASVATYGLYSDQVDDLKTYLEENSLEESEDLTVLKSYLEDTIEPNDAFANGSAAYVLENHVLADSVVVEEGEFMESLKKAAVVAGYVAGTDITSMIVNRSFANAEQVLDEKGEKVSGKMVAEGWDGYIFGHGTNEAKTMSAAEFCNESAKFDVSQTMTGMKNGYYQIKLNAGFRPNGNINSFNYAAMAYANDVKTFVPAVREYMEEDKNAAWTGSIADKEIYACDLYTDESQWAQDAEIDSVVVGYVIWGVQGTINAILHDRYEITMVAQVTDGNLTFGLKNEGTTVGGDWMGAGNFRLTYLGEEATADAVAAAVASNAERAKTLTETYVIPEDAASSASDYKATPNFAAVQKEALSTIGSDLVAAGNLFQDIYDTKAAYYDLCVYKDAVYNKWINHPAKELDDDIYAIVDALMEGTYASAAEADAAKDALLAKYPDYLEIDMNKLSSTDVNEDSSNAFEYSVVADGQQPYVYFKNFYEPLTNNVKRTVLTFEYKSETAIEGGNFLFGTPYVSASHTIAAPALAATSEWTTVSIDITEAIKTWEFGKAVDHVIRWDIVGENTADNIALNVRNMIVAETEVVTGDLNGDGFVDGSDIQAVLNDMAEDENNTANDVNKDGIVDGSDIQAILNIMNDAE